jgi:hypothetical protein
MRMEEEVFKYQALIVALVVSILVIIVDRFRKK